MTQLIGYALIFLGASIWIYACYSIIISKWFVQRTGHKFLDWVKEDTYYCCTLPSYLLIMLIISYFNWAAMKYFRHAQ